jgi:hypothetical protein
MAVSILEKYKGLKQKKKDLFVNTFELPWTAG